MTVRKLSITSTDDATGLHRFWFIHHVIRASLLPHYVRFLNAHAGDRNAVAVLIDPWFPGDVGPLYGRTYRMTLSGAALLYNIPMGIRVPAWDWRGKS